VIRSYIRDAYISPGIGILFIDPILPSALSDLGLTGCVGYAPRAFVPTPANILTDTIWKLVDSPIVLLLPTTVYTGKPFGFS